MGRAPETHQGLDYPHLARPKLHIAPGRYVKAQPQAGRG
jgi:hypothetical protein